MIKTAAIFIGLGVAGLLMFALKLDTRFAPWLRFDERASEFRIAFLLLLAAWLILVVRKNQPGRSLTRARLKSLLLGALGGHLAALVAYLLMSVGHSGIDAVMRPVTSGNPWGAVLLLVALPAATLSWLTGALTMVAATEALTLVGQQRTA